MDTVGYTTALRSAVRQDPDIILVGELRDTESMEIALRAAETGHLVLATLHTTDAKETIGRFIDSFPAEQQRQIRLQLSFNLRAVISQRLLERADNGGLVLAAEIMVVNAAIRGYIQDPDKLHEIPENIAKGAMQYGMQTFDQAIMDLYSQGLIGVEELARQCDESERHAAEAASAGGPGGAGSDGAAAETSTEKVSEAPSFQMKEPEFRMKNPAKRLPQSRIAIDNDPENRIVRRLAVGATGYMSRAKRGASALGDHLFDNSHSEILGIEK